MGSGIECPFSKFADDIKLREWIQSRGIWTALGGGPCVNLMKFNKVKCKVLAHGSGQSQAHIQAGWGMDWE